MRIQTRAIIIKDKQLLLISGHDAEFHWLPGGGTEDGETPQQALHRELDEELGIKILVSTTPYDRQVLEDQNKVVNYFRIEVEGEIFPGNEITTICWYTKEHFESGHPKVTRLLREKIIPKLIADGLL